MVRNSYVAVLNDLLLLFSMMQWGFYKDLKQFFAGGCKIARVIARLLQKPKESLHACSILGKFTRLKKILKKNKAASG